jgi:Ser/Thr protein kinase RdoA (MazF antagonist)
MDADLGELIGTGKEAEVFRQGDHVLKLNRTGAPKSSAFREAANLAIAEALGLPAPAPLGVMQVGDRWGVLMTLAPGESFGAAILRQAELMPDYLGAMARLHAHILMQPGTGHMSLRARLSANIGRAPGLGDAERRRLLDEVRERPEGDRLCHGDFHPWNILGHPGGAIVVDWLDACSGPPEADICRSYVLMQPPAPELAEAYIAVCEASGLATRAEILAWSPVVAAARLAEGVKENADALMEMVRGQ